jgi:hypothetical protein
LVDDHLWWSVFSRPVRSRFTRTQRVSVCMATMYLFFLVNAMFYGSTTERQTEEPLFSAGFLKFYLSDVSPWRLLIKTRSNIVSVRFERHL